MPAKAPSCQETLDELLASPESAQPRNIHLPDGVVVFSRGGGYANVANFGGCDAAAYDSAGNSAIKYIYIVGSDEGIRFIDETDQTNNRKIVPYADPTASQVRAVLHGQ